MGKEVRGLGSTNWYLQNSPGGVNYSIGNGEAKEFICMTDGHELRGSGKEMLVGGGVQNRGE